MTKNEDDQKRRKPKTKTTKNENDQKGGYLKIRTEASLIESYGPTMALSSFLWNALSHFKMHGFINDLSQVMDFFLHRPSDVSNRLADYVPIYVSISDICN